MADLLINISDLLFQGLLDRHKTLVSWGAQNKFFALGWRPTSTIIGMVQNNVLTQIRAHAER